MAKVGYIFIATNGEEYAEDKAWMQQYGCVQVIEELSEHERLRPMWKQLISSLERGDELVVVDITIPAKLSAEEKRLVEQLAAQPGFQKAESVKNQNIFERMKSFFR